MLEFMASEYSDTFTEDLGHCLLCVLLFIILDLQCLISQATET